MSHWIYTNKNMLETKDGRVILFCQIADSSVRDEWGRHPKYWTFISFSECTTGLLHPKKVYKDVVKNMIEKELQALRDFNERYPDLAGEKEVSVESYNYNGNTYNGSRKIKALRAFFSAQRTIPADEFLSKNPVCFEMEYVGHGCKKLGKYYKHARNEQELIEAHDFLVSMRKNIGQREGATGVWCTTSML